MQDGKGARRGRAGRPPGHKRAVERAGMAALVLGISGLFFWLSYAALGEPTFALILTLLAMLPAAGLATSSASGQIRR